MKRIAVITTFVDLLEAFSLCGVVESQVKLLLSNSYPTTFVACDGFRGNGVFADPALRHLRLPNSQLENDGDAVKSPTEFASKVEAIKLRLRPLLPDIDVVITHDIIYLQHHLAYNQACRELADEFPHIFWLHWIHSAPEPHRSFSYDDPRSARYKRFPRGMLIYPNAYDVVRVSQQYGVGQEEVRVIPHGLDYAKAFNFHDLSKALIERYSLYSPDIFAIYPIRMDRGKQPEKLVRLFSEIRKAGKSACLLIVNFHSTGQHFIDYRDDTLREVRELGLTDEEVIFTNRIESLPGISEQDLQRYRVEFPHKVVMDLFQLSNIYVHASASETYSLVCQEAAACGNLLFLNDDFPPMREIYGSCANYIKFSSTLFTTTHRPTESAYYAEVARKIFYHLEVNQTVKQKTRIRQTRNLQTVFRNHLEPLFYSD